MVKAAKLMTLANTTIIPSRSSSAKAKPMVATAGGKLLNGKGIATTIASKKMVRPIILRAMGLVN